MSICVVGGTGFIGRHLCQALHRHCLDAFSTSRAPDHEFLRQYAPSIIGIPLDDRELWSRIAETETVVYLGSSTKPSSSWRAPSDEIERGVGDIARFIRKLLDINPKCHFIYASSGGTIYGPHHQKPITEANAAAPATAYALCKHLAEQVLRFHAAIDNARITILRIANPVGLWQMGGRHGLISALVNAAVHSGEVTIYGDGDNVRDYFDADDLANAIIAVVKSVQKTFQIYNVSSGQGLSDCDAIALVENTLNIKIRCCFRPAREFDLRYSVLDPHRMLETYGWRSETPLAMTVSKMYHRSSLLYEISHATTEIL